MKILAVLLLTLSIKLFAQEIPGPDDDVVFFMQECKTIVIDFRVKPKLQVSKGDPITVYCERTNKKNELKCNFFEGETLLAEKSMIAVIGNGNLLVTDPDNTDRFLVNLTTQVFFSESYINVKQIIYGKKICTGVMAWASEFKQQQKPKKGKNVKVD